MKDFFAALLLGHLIGDFLLQNKWMAMNKAASSFKCGVHCLIYTAAVSATTWPMHSWAWSALIFASHFPVDRWSLADKWLRLIRGRALTDFISNGYDNIPGDVDQGNYHALRAGFAAVVYTAADTTMHLVLMYYGGQWL